MTTPTFGRFAPRLITALALLCSSLAGCAALPATGEAEAVRLRVLMTDDWGDRPAFLTAVKEFERDHDGVRVEITKLPIRNMADAVRGQVGSGDPADLVQWHAYAAGAQGLAEPVDDLWEQAGMKESEFFPAAVADVAWGGRIYGVPLDINALVLFYRPDRFAAANLDPPGAGTTFADLERYGPALTSPDGSRRMIALANSYWAAFGWVRANGGELVIVEDGTPRFTLDSPPVVDTLSFLSRMVKGGYAFAPAGANSSVDSLALFRSGSTAIHASGSWDLAKLDQENLGTPYGAALMPRAATGATQGTVTGGSSMFVPKGSPNRELAFELMRTVISDEHALRLAKEEGRLPVRPRVYTDPFFDDPALNVVLEQLETARPLFIEAFPEAASAWDAAFNDVLRNGADPATALRAAQDRAEASLASAES
jgi:ABC-type glycerol-3-phosphate transport system substrate-binding protein